MKTHEKFFERYAKKILKENMVYSFDDLIEPVQRKVLERERPQIIELIINTYENDDLRSFIWDNFKDEYNQMCNSNPYLTKSGLIYILVDEYNYNSKDFEFFIHAEIYSKDERYHAFIDFGSSSSNYEIKITDRSNYVNEDVHNTYSDKYKAQEEILYWYKHEHESKTKNLLSTIIDDYIRNIPDQLIINNYLKHEKYDAHGNIL